MESRLQNVVMPTQNFEDAVEFYRDRLDLPVHHEIPDQHCFLDAGGTMIAIHPANDDEFQPTGRGFYLDVFVSDLEAARESLEDIGVSEEKELDYNGEPGILVQDPDGNCIEILEESTEE